MNTNAQFTLVATERVKPSINTSAIEGEIKFTPLRALWLLSHGIFGLSGIFMFPQFDAFLVFVALTALTICAGHSVGMHRLLIHRSFETYPWVEYFLVWLGTLVGMAGPIGMITAHDMRDWHQRQDTCPPHPSHRASFWKDAWWQLCCHYKLRSPPEMIIEPKVKRSFLYQLMEHTWMAQQLPLALILYAVGGWAYVLWGISLRVFVSLVGHWIVGHYAHQPQDKNLTPNDLQVQGRNLPNLGIVTFGENWHGNHHAYPSSARLGVYQGQFDPGYIFILGLKKLGLAWNIKLPFPKQN